MFSVIINSPAPGTERAVLAEAIERFDRAVAHLDRARQAKEATNSEWLAASRTLDVARTALSDAEASAPSRRLATLMGQTLAEDAETIEELQNGIANAEAALQTARADDQLITAEIDRARTEAEWAKNARQVAAGKVLRVSPGLAALLLDLHGARRRVATIFETISTVSGVCPEALPSFWNSRRAEDHVADSRPAHEWKAAIERLLTNPDAPLPGDTDAPAEAA